MSRRLPTSTLAVLFVLLAGAVAVLLAERAEAYGERWYDANQIINAANLDVYAGQSVAQSFVAMETYNVLSVTLRLQNTGSPTDPINVSIRADAGYRPADASLAATEIVAGETTALVNISIPGAPVLAKASRYWIVATHAGLLSDAYRWYHSNGNRYGNGWAVFNLNLGAGWVNQTPSTDMYFATYGREADANVTAGMAVTPTQANPKDLVIFTIYYNNTGTSAAQNVWINDTLPPGMSYVSDTAAGSSTLFPNYTFANVPNGVHSFTLTARVDVGVEPGTVLSNTAQLAYLNATGSPRAGSTAQASVTIGLVAKQLYLVPGSGNPRDLTPVRPTGGVAQQLNVFLKKGDPPIDFDLAPRLARPFRVTDLDVLLFLDSATHKPENLDVNLTFMDWNGVSLVAIAYHQERVRTNNFDDYQRFAFAFAPLDYTFAVNQQIRIRVRNMGSGTDDAFLAVNSTFADSRLVLTTSTYVRVDAVSLRDQKGPTSVWSPKDALVVRANVSDPFGSGDIMGARINLTAPGGAAVVGWQAMNLLATDPSSPSSWKLFEFAFGPPLGNGTYSVEVVGIEGNGVIDAAQATALVRSPKFALTKIASAVVAKGGDTFSYHIWYNNTGAGAARIWLNDTLPSEVTFLSSSDPGAKTGDYNWTWASVAPGSHQLVLDVQVKGGLPPTPFIRNRVTVDYADEKGYLWPRETAQLDIVTEGPVIAFAKTSVSSWLHSNETLSFTLTLANTGDEAQTLWLNDTLPAGLLYVSDTAASLGGTSSVSGGVVRFVFSSMPGGTTWSFALVARAGPGLAAGTSLTNRADLNYTNTNGVLMPPRQASWSLTVAAPRVPFASVAVAAANAQPGDALAAVVDFANDGTEPSPMIWLNLTLDAYLAFVDASRPASVSGTDLRFALSNVGVATYRIFLNLSVLPTVPDGRTLGITGTLEYRDGYGNTLPAVALAPDAVWAQAPRIVLGVTPGNATIEAGISVRFSVSHANAGSGAAGDVWLNLSLPASLLYVSDTSDGTRSSMESMFMWHWSGQVPGPKSFDLDLLAKAGVSDQTIDDLSFRLEYADANGNPRTPATYVVRALLVRPKIELTLDVDRSQVPPGSTATYTLRLRNAGSTIARTAWLIDSVDGRLEIVSYNSRVRADGAPNLNWTFLDIAPGQEEVLTLVVRVAGGLAPGTPIANVIETVYTNSQGDVIGYVRSASVTLYVIADALPLVYIVAGGGGLGSLAVLLVSRRHRGSIEEVFLVYRDGILMYHISRSLVEDKDSDVLSGMLTVVQEFVRDAFRYGERRELHQLDFGDYRIIIERGKLVYLAIVYAGHESASLKKRVRGVLNGIEATYGHVLENWDGDMDRIIGARDMIRDNLLTPNGRRAKPIPRPA